MKKSILFFVIGSLTSGAAFAQSGSATVSHLQSSFHNSSSRMESFIHLTNTSETDTEVTIKIYNQSGNVVSDVDNDSNAGLLRASNISNYSDVNSSYSVKFTIAPKHSTRVSLMNPSTAEILGYAVIEWKKESTTEVVNTSLIGHAINYRIYNGTGYYSVPINDGRKF
jgi:hypothetical protein